MTNKPSILHNLFINIMLVTWQVAFYSVWGSQFRLANLNPELLFWAGSMVSGVSKAFDEAANDVKLLKHGPWLGLIYQAQLSPIRDPIRRMKASFFSMGLLIFFLYCSGKIQLIDNQDGLIAIRRLKLFGKDFFPLKSFNYF
jgi:hypothetical protein